MDKQLGKARLRAPDATLFEITIREMKRFWEEFVRALGINREKKGFHKMTKERARVAAWKTASYVYKDIIPETPGDSYQDALKKVGCADRR